MKQALNQGQNEWSDTFYKTLKLITTVINKKYNKDVW